MGLLALPAEQNGGVGGGKPVRDGLYVCLSLGYFVINFQLSLLHSWMHPLDTGHLPGYCNGSGA